MHSDGRRLLISLALVSLTASMLVAAASSFDAGGPLSSGDPSGTAVAVPGDTSDEPAGDNEASPGPVDGPTAPGQGAGSPGPREAPAGAGTDLLPGWDSGRSSPFNITGSNVEDNFGWGVACAGDVNGDGVGDAMIGAPFNDSADGSRPDAGAVYIFYGHSGIDTGDLDVTDANVTIYGGEAGDNFGWSVSGAGDVDGGVPPCDDVVIGAPGYGPDRGRVYIFYGSASLGGTYSASDADVNITGEDLTGRFGTSVAGAGDFDNAAGADIVAGAPYISGDDWWDRDWSSRMKMTFNNSGQSETLTNIPVLVNLSSSNFNYSLAKPDGTDLRFVDADGLTELKYHIEEWNPSGYSYVWVNVTSMDGGSSADGVWMYHDNPAAADVQDVSGTYDDSYIGVWHLNETSGIHRDSTSNGNDGTPLGGVAQDASGPIAGADRFDGFDDVVDCGSGVSLDPGSAVTVEAWVDNRFSEAVTVLTGEGAYTTGHDIESSSFVIVDVDGDGEMEIVTASKDNSVYVLNHSGSALSLEASHATGGEVKSPCAVADVDGDGTLEIVVGSKDSKVHVLSHDGSSITSEATFTAGDWFEHAGPAIADVDDDGELEIIIGCKDDKVYVLNHSGSAVSVEDSYTTGNDIKTTPSVADVDGDGELEIVIGSNDNKLYVLNHTGSSLDLEATISAGGDFEGTSPAIADVDGDGQPEIIVGNKDTDLHVYNHSGSALSQEAAYNTGLEIRSSAAIGDVDGDGELEISVGSRDHYIYVLNHSGSGLSLEGNYSTGDDVERGGVSLADVDGDGALEIVAASRSGKVYVLRHSGSSLTCEDTYTTGGELKSEPTIGDVDGDGELEIVIGGWDDKIHVIGAGGLSRVDWTMHGHDLNVTNHLEYPYGIVSKGEGYGLWAGQSGVISHVNQGRSADDLGEGWSHVVMTYDGDDLRTYVDGALVQETPLTGAVSVDPDALLLGGNFKGRLDEVRVSRTARSSDWIAAQYICMNGSMVTYGADESQRNGKAYLFFGDGSMPAAAEDADRIFTGEKDKSELGASLASAGDVNGDGFDDIVAGAPGADRAYIFHGENATTKGTVGNVTLSGPPGSGFGWSVAGCGDIDGDGTFDDVMVGAPNSTNGDAYIFFGGGPMNLTSQARLTGERPGDGFGASVSRGGGAGGGSPGGFGGIIIGAPYADEGGLADRGAVYICHGSSAFVPGSSTTVANYTLYGDLPGDRLGWSVSHAGDLDADSFAENLLGAPGHDDGAENDTGRVRVNQVRTTAGIRTLYLRDDGSLSSLDPVDTMNTTRPGELLVADVDADGSPGLTVVKGYNPADPATYQLWYLTPDLPADLDVHGHLGAVLWVDNGGNASSLEVLAVELFMTDGMNLTTIGTAEASFTLDGTSASGDPLNGFQGVPVTVPFVNRTIPAGYRLGLNVTVDASGGNDLWLAYNRTDDTSLVTLPTSDGVVLESMGAYDISDAGAYVFPAGSALRLRANVSSPFTQYDVAGANITVTGPGGGAIVDGGAMAFEGVDPESPSMWKSFNYTAPEGLFTAPGTYTVNVSGRDQDGGTVNGTFQFTVIVGPVAIIEVAPYPAVGTQAGQETGFTALARDACGNLNTSWADAWGMDMGLGALNDTGGLTMGYRALTAGTDRINVSCPATGAWNRTEITVEPGPVVDIALLPSGPVALQATESALFSAEGRDACGNVNTSWTDAWAMDAGLGALTDTGGLTMRYDARTAGVDRINVSCPATGVWNRTLVAVEPGPVADIALDPAGPVTLQAAASRVFTAEARDAYGNVNTTWTDAWAMDAGLGSLTDTGGLTMRYNGETGGADRINVSCPATGAWNVTRIDVTPGPVADIVLDPSNPVTLQATFNLAFTAEARDMYGNVNTTWADVWAMDSGLGALTDTGGSTMRYDGQTAGVDHINVSCPATGVWNRTRIEITPGPVADIALAPAGPVTLQATADRVFTAEATDAYGNVNTTWTDAWAMDASLGILSDTGGLTMRYEAQTAGMDHINVSCPATGAWNRTTITIGAGPVADIVLDPAGPVTVQATFSRVFTAIARDVYGNLNLTWTDGWAMDAGLGSLTDTGGLTMRYNGETAGTDHINVSCFATGVWNVTRIDITPGPVDDITLDPAGPVTLEATANRVFTAEARDAFNNLNTSWTDAWSMDFGLGALTYTGGLAMRYDARTAGMDHINVSCPATGVWNRAMITVSAGPVADIVLDPADTVTVQATLSRSFTAYARDIHGNLNLTWTDAWGMDMGLGALTDTGGFTMRYDGQTSGTDHVNVSCPATGVWNRTRIEVVPGPVADIVLDPADLVALQAGENRIFQVTGYDIFGNLNTTWIDDWSMDANLGSLHDEGDLSMRYDAQLAGVDSINVTCPATGAWERTRITVEPGPVEEITIHPRGLVTIQATDSRAFRAVGLDDFGNVNTTWVDAWTTKSDLGTLNDTGGFTMGYDARTTGTDRVTVSCPATGARERADINIVAGPVVRIETYAYPAVWLRAGESAVFGAAGFDVLGNENHTWNDTWSLDDGPGTLVDLEEHSVKYSSTTAGMESINVTCFATGAWSRTEVTVVPGPLDSIRVKPRTADVPAHGQKEFTTHGSDRYGNKVVLTDVVWSTGAGEISVVNADSAIFYAGGTPILGGWVNASQGTVSGSAAVNVRETFDPPIIVGTIPDQRAVEDGETWLLDLSYHFLDVQDPPSGLRWYVTDEDPYLVQVTGERTWGQHVLMFTPLPDAYGDDLITIWLQDSDGEVDSQELWVNITPVNDAPVIQGPLPDLEGREDKGSIEFDLGPFGSDIDNSARQLSWEVLGWDAALFASAEVSGDRLILVPAPDAWGGDELTVVLGDGELQDTCTVQLNVTPVNDAPAIQPIPPQTGREGEGWSLDLSQYCHDPDDAFSSLTLTTDTDEAYVEGSRLVFTGSPTSPARVHLTVSDGRLATAVDIELTVIQDEEPGGTDGAGPGDGGGHDGTAPMGTDEGSGPEPGTVEYYFIKVAQIIKDYSYAILAIILFTFFTIVGVIFATVYRVEEVFLIHYQKGSVIHYLSHTKKETMEKEVLGSMLTVFHSFVKEAFTEHMAGQSKDKVDEPDLTQFNVGRDKKVMIEVGDHLYMALIYKGSQLRLRRRLKRVLARLEKKYGATLARWDGDLGELKGSREMVSRLLTRSISKDQVRRSLGSYLTVRGTGDIDEQGERPERALLSMDDYMTAELGGTKLAHIPGGVEEAVEVEELMEGEDMLEDQEEFEMEEVYLVEEELEMGAEEVDEAPLSHIHLARSRPLKGARRHPPRSRRTLLLPNES